MKITLRVQYDGGRARALAAQKLEISNFPPRYETELRQDLDPFDFPLPHALHATWLSGFVTCTWDVKEMRKDHIGIRAGFMRASRSAKTLEDKNIRFMLLTDAGQTFSTPVPGKRCRLMQDLIPTPSSSSVLPAPSPAMLRSQRSRSPSSGKAQRPSTTISMARNQSIHAPISRNNWSNANTTPTQATSSTAMARSVNLENVSMKPEPHSPGKSERPGVLSSRRTDVQSDSPRPAKLPPDGPKAMSIMFSSASSPSSSSHRSPRQTRDAPARYASSSSKGDAHALTRELWDVRRQVAALKAQEDTLERELRRLRVPKIPEPPSTPHEDAPEERQDLEEQIRSLRMQLRKESSERYAAQSALEEEGRRRKHAEGVVDDCRRESSKPFVVPALMDAFVKIAQITGEVMAEVELDYGSTSRAHL